MPELHQAPLNRLRILQLNLNKSEKAHHDLINRSLGKDWDILLIQEPYITKTGIIRTPNGYSLLYPQDRYKKDAGKVRSVTMVSSGLATSSWKGINIPGNNDITITQITHQEQYLSIINIYNDCEDLKTITTLRQLLQTRRQEIFPTENAQALWCGDFNMHHPLWDRDEDHRLFTPSAGRRAQRLIQMVADEAMKMALPKGIPTLKHFVTGRYTRPDNVWSTANIYEHIVRCNVDPSLQPPGTDHLPVIITIDIPQTRIVQPASYNFRMADWPAFREYLLERMTHIPEAGPITTDEELQIAADTLTTVLQETIQATVKVNKPCPHSKRWWNQELDNLRKTVNKLSRTTFRNRAVPEHESHEQYKEASRQYGDEIAKAKIQHWQDFLEDATTEELWTANKYIKEPAGDGGRARIPTLKVKQEDGTTKNVDTNEGKTTALARSFFPPKPLATSVPENYEYPEPLPDPPQITKEQIQEQIKRLLPYKASSPDGIPNIVLQRSMDIIEEYLLHIYRATLTLQTYVDSWREFTTVVLRKPSKPDYEIAKAYRPIVLLSTMSKILTAIIADEIGRTVEWELLLPENHYRGRAGRMTTDAVHILEDKIKSAWRKGKVVSVLFLDVEGAFPNAVNDRLIYNLHKRRIPEIHIEFVRNLLRGRRTKLKFDDFISALILIFNGIGQGDPLSMILYILYNADLLELARTPDEDSLGFVDDALGLAIGKTFKDTTRTLKDFMERPVTGGFRWGYEHNSKFEIDKLAVVHFTRQREADPQHPGKTRTPKHPILILQGKTIKNVESYKYLGMHIDRQLHWKTQMQKTISKATSYVLLFRRLTKHSTGISARLMRQLYLSVAIPKMTYGLDIWYIPPHKEEGK